MWPLNRTISKRRQYVLPAVAICALAACWWSTTEATAGLLLNTGQLALAVLLIAMPLAALLAYATSRCHIPLNGFWQSSMLVLLFVPLYIQLASWEAGFGRGGWYSTLIAGQLSNPPLEGFRGAVWVHAMAAVPWLYWIFRLGFVAIPRTYEEVAMLDGRPWQVFYNITLPLSLPMTFAAGLYVSIVVSTEITVTDRYQFRSYAEVLYNEFVLNTSFKALPLSVAPILGSLICVSVCGLLLCKLVWPSLVHPTVDRNAAEAKPNWLAFITVASLVSFLLLLPIGNLIYQAGIEVRQGAVTGIRESPLLYSPTEIGRVRGWSFSKLIQIVTSSPIRYQNELAWTAILAQLSVLFAVFAATVLGWWARKRRWRQTVNASLAIACFVIPGPFLGLGVIWALNRPSFLGWLYNETLFAPWLALTIRCFPYAYLIIWYGMISIPKTLFEAAEADGASSWSSLRHVAIPMLKPSLICAVLVCLAVSIGELSASILLVPPGVTTVATEIFNLIHYGAEDQLAGLCLACLSVILVITFFASMAIRRLAAAPENR